MLIKLCGDLILAFSQSIAAKEGWPKKCIYGHTKLSTVKVRRARGDVPANIYLQCV